MPKTKGKPTPAQLLGRNIRAARQAAEISVRELADTLGVGEQAIYAWERGAKSPRDLQGLLAITRALKTTPSELFAGVK